MFSEDFTREAQFFDKDILQTKLAETADSHQNVEKRAVVKRALTAISRAMVNSGRAAVMWYRGRQAMKVILKDAKLVTESSGVKRYFKSGGTKRAIRDFIKAGLTRKGTNKELNSYFGWAGDVSITLTRVGNGAKVEVLKVTDKNKKGEVFVVKYE